MLRFNSPNRRPARNYLSRREQWRLMMLIVPLGLIIILMRQLSAPQTAERINEFFVEDDPVPRPIAAVADNGAAIPTAEHEIVPVTEAPKILRDVDRELLKPIEDNTYFRNAEQQAWFHLLAILRAAPADELAAAATKEVSYVQLTDQPHAYRGRLVTVRGNLREATQQKPADNDLGFNSYHRVVIEPADGAAWPIFVYCLDVPPNLSKGDEIGPVTATGFFFKNLSYRWQDGLGIAPVILAKDIQSASMDPKLAPATNRPAPPISEASGENNSQPADAAAGSSVPFREVLALAGWNAERLAAFDDGKELNDEEQLQSLELLRRMRTFGAASLEAWSSKAIPIDTLTENPTEHHGQLLRLSGRVQRVTRHSPPAEEAERLELPEYYECELALANGQGVATILSSRVPRAWLEMPTLDDPASAVALFLKQLPPSAGSGRLFFVANEVAWHPVAVSEPFVSFGESLLGGQGVDVGLLDGVQNHRPVLASEREAFYQVLGAAGKFGSNQLIRSAHRNLKAYAEAWSEKPKSIDASRQALAHEVKQRAEDGYYSVASLFNDADNQVGELFSFDGMARRVLRVETGTSPHGGGPSDVLRRFGIDHYYELELFTDDSQNRPIIFCVRELPRGFATGADVRVPVRVAGFFFKSWRYHAGDSADEPGNDNLSGALGSPMISPLLIGPAPIQLAIEESGGPYAGLIGSLVLATIAGIWGAVWWWGRGDRQFYRHRLASSFTLPPGESLNDLPAAGDETALGRRNDIQADAADHS